MRIFILIGTQSELIKMASVFKEFDKRKIPYYFIHTGQHTQSAKRIIEDFNLKQPDFYITKREHDLKTISECLFWIAKCLFRGYKLKNLKKGDLIILHGDTESTLIGFILAKLKRCKIAHVEAGLRSFNIFNPFPEEVTRRIVDRFSDYLFTPGNWAMSNLKKEETKGKIINTHLNTNFNSLSYILKTKPKIPIPQEKYAILMLHRKETIYLGTRLKKAIECIEEITKKMTTLFIMSDKTKHSLKKKGLFKETKKNKNLQIKNFYNYLDFVHLLKNCEFVATDGGSLQEETFFLNKPCLLLRERTERKEGLGETAFLSKLDIKKIKYFINNYQKFKRKRKINPVNSAKIIADNIKKYLE